MKIPLYALPHRVKVIPFLGSGAYGPDWDEENPKRNVPCLIETKTQRVRSANGDDVIQQAEAMFHPDYKISQGDKIQWAETGAEFTVEMITPVHAMGLHHYEAVLV